MNYWLNVVKREVARIAILRARLASNLLHEPRNPLSDCSPAWYHTFTWSGSRHSVQVSVFHGDGWDTLATITLPTTITEECEIAVFFANESADQMWQVRPLSLFQFYMFHLVTHITSITICFRAMWTRIIMDFLRYPLRRRPIPQEIRTIFFGLINCT